MRAGLARTPTCKLAVSALAACPPLHLIGSDQTTFNDLMSCRRLVPSDRSDVEYIGTTDKQAVALPESPLTGAQIAASSGSEIIEFRARMPNAFLLLDSADDADQVIARCRARGGRGAKAGEEDPRSRGRLSSASDYTGLCVPPLAALCRSALHC